METLTQSATVTVHPFTRQIEADEIVIGRVETGIFLALPPDAVEILDQLRSGKTIGEAQESYRCQYGEIPDMQDFLNLLEKRGFVSYDSPSGGSPGNRAVVEAKPVRHHFEQIPRSVAEKIFSPIAVKLSWLVISLALLASGIEPGIVPHSTALYFARNRSVNAIVLFLLGYAAVFLHELGHLVAARAVGVGSRMSIGHRLWILVAETDLTGLWSVPKRERYLPLLAGPLVDAVSASLLLLLLFTHARAWITLPGPIAPMLEALVFLYILRLVWQCFFFVRTDFYYVIASFFNCRNLLGDTEAFLRNLLAKFGWLPYKDQHHIPAREIRVIRAYAVVWLAGRLLAFGVLFFVTLPVMFRYARWIIQTVVVGYSADPYTFIDSIVLTVLTVCPLVAGLGLWLWNLAKIWSQHHGSAIRST
jgi:putative peptide zinc metalloprotease protein